MNRVLYLSQNTPSAIFIKREICAVVGNYTLELVAITRCGPKQMQVRRNTQIQRISTLLTIEVDSRDAASLQLRASLHPLSAKARNGQWGKFTYCLLCVFVLEEMFSMWAAFQNKISIFQHFCHPVPITASQLPVGSSEVARTKNLKLYKHTFKIYFCIDGIHTPYPFLDFFPTLRIKVRQFVSRCASKLNSLF